MKSGTLLWNASFSYLLQTTFVIILQYLESRISSFKKHIYTFGHLKRFEPQIIKKPKRVTVQ